MEKFFIINNFRSDWDREVLKFYDMALLYCVVVLDIPPKKIENLHLSEYGLEVTLENLEVENENEKWYVNLFKF